MSINLACYGIYSNTCIVKKHTNYVIDMWSMLWASDIV